MTPEPNTLDEGIRLLQAGDLQAALGHLEQAAGENPSEARAFAYLGIARCRLGDLAGGVAALGEAAGLAPGDAGAHYNLGVALAQAQRVPEARAALEQARALDPNDVRARTALDRLAPDATTGAEEMAPVGGSAPPTPSPVGMTMPGVSAPEPGAGMRYTPPTPTPQVAAVYAPSAGLRIARGLGWGAVYGQWWTLWKLFSRLLWGSQGSRGGFSLPDLLFDAVFYLVVFAVAGAITGLIIGAVNADTGRGALIGVGAGLLMLGLQYLLLRNGFVLINVFFWFFTGRYVGAMTAARVQQPIPIPQPVPR